MSSPTGAPRCVSGFCTFSTLPSAPQPAAVTGFVDHHGVILERVLRELMEVLVRSLAQIDVTLQKLVKQVKRKVDGQLRIYDRGLVPILNFLMTLAASRVSEQAIALGQLFAAPLVPAPPLPPPTLAQAFLPPSAPRPEDLLDLGTAPFAAPGGEAAFAPVPELGEAGPGAFAAPGAEVPIAPGEPTAQAPPEAECPTTGGTLGAMDTPQVRALIAEASKSYVPLDPFLEALCSPDPDAILFPEMRQVYTWTPLGPASVV